MKYYRLLLGLGRGRSDPDRDWEGHEERVGLEVRGLGLLRHRVGGVQSARQAGNLQKDFNIKYLVVHWKNCGKTRSNLE